VNVCCGGVPVPLVIAPALAVIVTVPAFGVPAAIVPTFQRTIVPDEAGITVGAGSEGDEELDAYVNPGGSVSSRTAFWSAALRWCPWRASGHDDQKYGTPVSRLLVSAGAGSADVISWYTSP
jgi:hypothetical protein